MWSHGSLAQVQDDEAGCFTFTNSRGSERPLGILIATGNEKLSYWQLKLKV